uniref:Uncharacterized protein n=1 Tax=Octopus bimaculoides TaxID=37653 RepID=A0A0L8GE05_OCTBM
MNIWYLDNSRMDWFETQEMRSIFHTFSEKVPAIILSHKCAGIKQIEDFFLSQIWFL